MSILYILFLGILGTAKVTVQGKFGRKNVVSMADAIFFNGLIFLFSSLLFIKDAFTADPVTIFYAIAFGISSALFQMTYLQAIACGNMSITVMLVNFSIVIPVAVSLSVYGEQMTWFRGIGMALIAISFVLCTNFKGAKGTTKKWIIMASLATLSNGVANLVQKLFAAEGTGLTQAYVSWGYLFATIFSVILYLILHASGHKKTFRTRPNVFGYACATGLILGTFQFFYSKGAQAIDGSVFFPTYSGAAIILSALTGVVLFKDKLSVKQIISTVCGTAALILMNM